MTFASDAVAEDESPGRLLEQWVSGMPPVLVRLRDQHLPEDFPFDFTPESLDHLEAFLLQHSGSGTAAEEEEFVESAMAYLGEVLMRTAGGTWGWHTGTAGNVTGQPVACPDAELQLRPLAPFLLISHALKAGTGEEFALAHERLCEAVAERQTQDPEWAPVKEYTPGVDPEPSETQHL